MLYTNIGIFSMGNSMTESTDLIAKRAAYAGLVAAITLHVERSEQLASEAQSLRTEIEEIESRSKVIEA